MGQLKKNANEHEYFSLCLHLSETTERNIIMRYFGLSISFADEWQPSVNLGDKILSHQKASKDYSS